MIDKIKYKMMIRKNAFCIPKPFAQNCCLKSNMTEPIKDYGKSVASYQKKMLTRKIESVLHANIYFLYAVLLLISIMPGKK